jgi:hypothetical protein
MYKTNIFLNNVDKFKLRFNEKEPAVAWTKKHNHNKFISLKYNNVGIPCGKDNNLIVIDIDNKDEGIEEFENYLKLFGKLDTLIVKSVNNGFHYYFTYKHSVDSATYLIKNSLTNSTKYRGKGIDVRTKGGYIVAPESSINNKKYTIINNVEPIEIPETLLLWLLEGREYNNKINKKNKLTTKNTKKGKSVKKVNTDINIFINNYCYDITDEKIKYILINLDASWYNAFEKWFIVLTVLKNLNKFEIFDEFSKKGNNYDYEKNLKMWNSNTGCIDINYLIIRLNQEQPILLPLIEKCKFLPENTMFANIKNITFNKKHLEIDDDIFDYYDTLIIKSDTGTGKTTHTGKQLNRYFNYVGKKYQLVSIVNLINLAKQQSKSFKDSNVQIKSYKDDDVDFIDGNFIICINSLKLLDEMDDYYFNNKIIYIDEVTSFLEGLTHNEKLNDYIKTIYDILIKLLKRAHKVITTDATIMDNVFDFLKFRNDDKKVYIVNEFKKYQNIEAVRMKDENIFLNNINEHIEKNKYFLFGSDSCEIITKIYLKCVKDYSDKAKDMILITSKSKFDIKDANMDFLNKWVFYSPSIVTGVDFSIEQKQDHFIYIKGNSISPVSIYQQTTRNRNIDKLFYYVESTNKNEKYNSLEAVKNNYKKLIEINKNINNICKQFDEKEDTYINENMYFNLFCYNEYILDIYSTNKRLHYENILKDKGFIIKSEGEIKKANQKSKKIMKELYDNQDLVNEYLLDTNVNKKKDIKYLDLISDIKFFNLQNNEDVLKYKTILNDKFEKTQFLNFIKLFNCESDEIILNKNTFDIKNITSINEKIKIIKKLYSDHKIKYLSLDEFDKVTSINISNDEFIYIKKLFRCEKEKPINISELKYLIVGTLKNLIGKLGIINAIQNKNKKNISVYSYSFENDKIQFYKTLHKKIRDKLVEI